MKKSFKNLLDDAAFDDISLIRILEYLMPTINKEATSSKGILDEDLKSELIKYCIEIIKNKKFQKKCNLF